MRPHYVISTVLAILILFFLLAIWVRFNPPVVDPEVFQAYVEEARASIPERVVAPEDAVVQFPFEGPLPQVFELQGERVGDTIVFETDGVQGQLAGLAELEDMPAFVQETLENLVELDRQAGVALAAQLGENIASPIPLESTVLPIIVVDEFRTAQMLTRTEFFGENIEKAHTITVRGDELVGLGDYLGFLSKDAEEFKANMQAAWAEAGFSSSDLIVEAWYPRAGADGVAEGVFAFVRDFHNPTRTITVEI